MPATSKPVKSSQASTRVVNAEIFKQVYDSPHSLPGKEKWITSDQDVRTIERLLGMPPTCAVSSATTGLTPSRNCCMSLNK
jgi:hypothetical protein